MSAADSDSPSPPEASDHAYFQAIEEAFIRLRGAPFLLSPEDWRVAVGWREAGVPVQLVERVLERILRDREEAESGRSRRIRGLRYFDSAVAAAWKNARAMTGSETARTSAPMDVEGRLSALAAALPTALDGREVLARGILAAGGETEAVESRLAELDREMIAGARGSLTTAEEDRLGRRVEEGLERLGSRLSGEELEIARRRLERQILRRMLDLPLLSLFSPQARGADET